MKSEMNINLLNCIDTMWFFRRERRKAAIKGNVVATLEPVSLPPQSSAPAMMMASRDVGPLALRVAARLAEWQQRRASRRALMIMSERDLKDIGLCRASAEEEYRKPFWR